MRMHSFPGVRSLLSGVDVLCHYKYHVNANRLHCAQACWRGCGPVSRRGPAGGAATKSPLAAVHVYYRVLVALGWLLDRHGMSPLLCLVPSRVRNIDHLQHMQLAEQCLSTCHARLQPLLHPLVQCWSE